MGWIAAIGLDGYGLTGMALVVVHLHQLSLGGAERITVMWCQWLVEMGHQVQLFLGQSDEDEFFLPPESVQIIRRPAGLLSVVAVLKSSMPTSR